MDPERNQGSSGTASSPGQSGQSGPETGQPVRHPEGFTVFTPNPTRRTEMTSMAQREQENLQRYRETSRCSYSQEDPQRLGGARTQSEVRQQQSIAHRSCKQQQIQKKLQREELERTKKQQENEALQVKKDQQREKSERLQEKKRQDEQTRNQRFSGDHSSKNNAFLQRLKANGGAANAGGNVEPTLTELQIHEPDPESSLKQEEDLNSDSWNLMELVRSFPNVERDFLQEILEQCDGDYDRAFSLLSV